MQQPKVSVVIPSLNSIKYIRECIDSVINQTLKDIEIICVDANSTDGTLEVLKEYEKNDKRLRVIVSDKKSYGHQMNLGIKAAKGEYLGIVESDDYIKENMYKELYKIAKEKDCDVVKSDYYRFAYGEVEYVSVIKPRAKVKFYNQLLNPQNDALNIFCETIGINQIGIYRLDLFRINQIALNETLGASYQDNGLWFQIFAFAKSAYFYNKAFYMLRRDNPNSSVKNTHKVYELCIEYDFIREFLRKNPKIEKRLLPFCTLHRFGNYCWTLSRIDEKYKKDFLQRWSKDFRKIMQNNEIPRELLGESNMKKLNFIIADPIGYYYSLKNGTFGAPHRIKSHLSYKFGQALLKAKNPIKALILPYTLFRIWKKHKFDQSVYETIIKLQPSLKPKPIEEYSDYEEALKVKKQLSYRLGNALIKHPLTFVFRIPKIYKEFKKDKSLAQTPMGGGITKSIRKDYEYFKNLPSSEYKRELEEWYEKRMGKKLNLKNPKSLTEKIQWLKLYDSTPLKTRLTDKYLVREWIREKIGEEYLIPLLGVYDKAEDIDFEKLPNKFVIKCNHGSGWVIIIRDKSTMNKQEVLDKLNLWMSKNYAYNFGLEIHYRDIVPKIIIEEYIENKEVANINSYTANEGLTEYKIMCFNGKPHHIWYTIDRCSKDINIAPKRDIYDITWNKMPFTIHYSNLTKPIEKPKQFQQLLALSEILAKDFCQVRVDWYILENGGIKFGELTFTSESGTSDFKPKIWDEKLGKMFKLPKIYLERIKNEI